MNSRSLTLKILITAGILTSNFVTAADYEHNNAQQNNEYSDESAQQENQLPSVPVQPTDPYIQTRLKKREEVRKAQCDVCINDMHDLFKSASGRIDIDEYGRLLNNPSHIADEEIVNRCSQFIEPKELFVRVAHKLNKNPEDKFAAALAMNCAHEYEKKNTYVNNDNTAAVMPYSRAYAVEVFSNKLHNVFNALYPNAPFITPELATSLFDKKLPKNSPDNTSTLAEEMDELVNELFKGDVLKFLNQLYVLESSKNSELRIIPQIWAMQEKNRTDKQGMQAAHADELKKKDNKWTTTDVTVVGTGSMAAGGAFVYAVMKYMGYAIGEGIKKTSEGVKS